VQTSIYFCANGNLAAALTETNKFLSLAHTRNSFGSPDSEGVWFIKSRDTCAKSGKRKSHKEKEWRSKNVGEKITIARLKIKLIIFAGSAPRQGFGSHKQDVLLALCAGCHGAGAGKVHAEQVINKQA
jgi:hypothetical protein